MLQNLHVKNLALIDKTEVEFDKGLNILTGETGAGKSIILGSVNLALGGRYTKDIIRKGTQYGFVELTFLVEREDQIKKLQELDIFPEEGMVVLSRRLMEGRSVSKINGETVSISTLKAVAEILIDIHGQHEHQSLLYKKHQMEILDAYAKDAIAQVKNEVKDSYKEFEEIRKELKEANSDVSDRAKEAAFLEFEINEIQEAMLVDGEDEELETAYRRMVNSKKIVENVDEAYEYTANSNDSASDSLSRAIRALSDAARYDEKAQELYDQLVEVDSLLNDFNRELSDYSSSLEFSEEDFYQTEERLNVINRLKTKYGNSIADILKYSEEKEARLQVLNDYDHYLEQLQNKYEKTENQLGVISSKLTSLRKKQARLLQEAIVSGLKDLNFNDVRFEIHFAELKDYTANGIDDIEFMISMNPGEPVKPLAEVASGGELSRIMLAIKTVMADRDEIETLIFDEIDVGISGRTAQKVSEKMAVIGKEHQVICITHLAQIAAMADAHYAIEKSVVDGKTRTGIRRLSAEEEIEELTRILGGAVITETVRESAREMKALAMQTK